MIFRLGGLEISGDCAAAAAVLSSQRATSQLSDPYMRLRMNDGRTYVPPYRIGETLGESETPAR